MQRSERISAYAAQLQSRPKALDICAWIQGIWLTSRLYCSEYNYLSEISTSVP
jgi:hypothetical protein